MSCAVTVAFAQFASDQQWVQIRKAILQAGRDMKLGVPQPFYGMNLNFDAARVSVALNAPSAVVEQTMGLSFTVLDHQDQVVERFTAARDNITLQTRAYARVGTLQGA